jgi:hypothetical protein
VAAIVLDHEQAQQKAGGGNDQDQPPPEAEVNRDGGQDPERHERHDGDRQFKGAAATVGLAVAAQNLDPRQVRDVGRYGSSYMHVHAKTPTAARSGVFVRCR